MVKIDIVSGFLGAGKTTLIRKLLSEAYEGEKVVLIENEFGEIGIDGGFLRDAGINITEINSGCICCSLVGDFSKALSKVIADYGPDRVLIEPSGVGKLSDIIRAVRDAGLSGAVLNCFTTVADVNKCKMYMKNFGEFFNDQIENAATVILSHTDKSTDEKVKEAVKLIREHNPGAVIITTPITELTADQLNTAMSSRNTLDKELEKLAEEEHHHHHHDDDDDDDEECGCHHHHHDDDDDDEECGCHHHHHDDDDDDEECECHHHHHDDDDDDEECECHHHHHDDDDDDEECECHHHHHHHADEVFTSIGRETTDKFTKEQIEYALKELMDEKYGVILRAKGVVANKEGKTWIHFDYVPGEPDVRDGSADVIGRICVIGSKINESEILKLFSLE